MAKTKNPTKLSELIPDDRNFNKGSEFGNALIEKSFRKFGAGRSILLDKHNRIIAGNKSVENAGAIGMENVIIVESDGTKIIAVKRTDIDLDSPIGREMALADNATAKTNIVFDAELITAELSEAICEEWGVNTDKIEPEAQEDDFSGVAPKEPITVLGDLYEINEHRLLCGDSTDSDSVAKLMNGKKADMIFTDPPYGMSYGGGRATGNHVKNKRGGVLIKAHGQILGDELRGESLLQMVKDSLLNGSLFKKDGGAAYVCFTWRTYSEFEDALIQSNFKPKACIVWNKKSIGLGYSNYRPQHEFIFYCDGQWFGANNESDVWELSRGATGDYVHPTQKPIELVARAITNSSKKDDIVLELFTGSGSTMVAAEQLNRKCFGMELDPKYCDVIVSRMIKLFQSSVTEFSIKRNGVLLSKEQVEQFITNTNA